MFYVILGVIVYVAGWFICLVISTKNDDRDYSRRYDQPNAFFAIYWPIIIWLELSRMNKRPNNATKLGDWIRSWSKDAD